MVSVTQDHISRGKKISIRTCPIALALKDYIKSIGLQYRFVAAGPNFIYIVVVEPSHETLTYRTPDDVRLMMTDFDRGNTIYPFTFPLNKEMLTEL